MKHFAELFATLDRSTATLDKRRALEAYFRDAAPADAAWGLWLLAGGKVGGARAKIAGTRELKTWLGEEAGLAEWLVEDCHEQVGDLAETLALLLDDPASRADDLPLNEWIEQRLMPIANRDEAERRAVVVAAWHSLPFAERLVFNKLLTGALRVGVSSGLVQQALAQASGVPIATIAQRMIGTWVPTATFFESLCSQSPQPGDAAQPYPFFLASPLEGEPDALGGIDDWQLEWKWDGIRVQLIRRGGEVALWSRGEERMDGRFPEIEAALAVLPVDAVIDGELLAWGEGQPRAFSALQTRIQRRKPGAKTLADTPVRVLAYDLLELNGKDLRQLPQCERRARLDALLCEAGDARIQPSPLLQPESWAEAAGLRGGSRERGVEGLMLKRKSAPYQSGRRRGDWWKWKIDPLTIDAVLIYAQAGHGRRSTLYTDYTFALWDGDALVPVAKAYSGLDDAEILRLDRWIRAHTLERFGPVRSVEPVHVFELGFEAVNTSARHKSGIAVRFPRILRWREDKTATEADRLETLKVLAQ